MDIHNMEDQSICSSKSKRIIGFRWNDEMIEYLLKTLQKYKSSMEYQGKDFDGDRTLQYQFLRKEIATRYLHLPNLPFGPVQVTTLSTENLSEEEVVELKTKIKDEQKNIKTGYHRVLEKVKEIRQKFTSAVTKGSRSGSGRVVLEHFDLLKDIYGGSASATALPSGIDSTSVNCGTSRDNIVMPEIEDSLLDNEDNLEDEVHSENENIKGSKLLSKKRKNRTIPNLIDEKRRHLEKRLSASERDAVLMREARDDISLRREIIVAINESNKSFSASMKDVSESMKVLGETMQNSMQMLIQSQQNYFGPPQHQYHQQYYPTLHHSTPARQSTPLRNTTHINVRNLPSTSTENVSNLSVENGSFLSLLNSSNYNNYEHNEEN